MERFEFERKQLMVLCSGVVLSSLLVFAAGVLVGVSFGSPAGAKALKEATQLAVEQGEKAAEKAAGQLAQKGPKGLAAVAKQLQSSDQTGAPSVPQAAGTIPTVQTTVPAAPAQQPVAALASPAAGALSATPAVSAPPLVLSVPEDRAPEKDVYCLQLGAFPDAKVARELQSDLRERGYRAEIFTAVDSEHREWHAVRIGGFPTLASASAAAASFTSRERIQALVRRSNAL